MLMLCDVCWLLTLFTLPLQATDRSAQIELICSPSLASSDAVRRRRLYHLTILYCCWMLFLLEVNCYNIICITTQECLLNVGGGVLWSQACVVVVDAPSKICEVGICCGLACVQSIIIAAGIFRMFCT